MQLANLAKVFMSSNLFLANATKKTTCYSLPFAPKRRRLVGETRGLEFLNSSLVADRVSITKPNNRAPVRYPTPRVSNILRLAARTQFQTLTAWLKWCWNGLLMQFPNGWKPLVCPCIATLFWSMKYLDENCFLWKNLTLKMSEFQR